MNELLRFFSVAMEAIFTIATEKINSCYCCKGPLGASSDFIKESFSSDIVNIMTYNVTFLL